MKLYAVPFASIAGDKARSSTALVTLAAILGAALVTGCGPGLTSRAASPKAPNDKMLQAADAELANAIVGTTTLTSAPLPPMPLPDSRMPVSGAAERAHGETPPPIQTWGATPEIDPELSEYGF